MMCVMHVEISKENAWECSFKATVNDNIVLKVCDSITIEKAHTLIKHKTPNRRNLFKNLF